MLHQLLYHPGLTAHELLQRQVPCRDVIQRLFPERRHAGIGDDGRQRIDQLLAGRRRNQGPLLPLDEAPLQQGLDDAGSRCLGADPCRLLETRLQALVCHEPSGMLHGGDQGALGEGLGRCRLFGQHLKLTGLAALPLAQRRQRGRFPLLVAAISNRRPGKEFAPPFHTHLPP